MLSRLFLCCGLALLPMAALADVKIRPGDKPSASTKDFIKDRKKNGYPTPEPLDRTFAFTTGMSVEVVLEAATSFLGNVKFTIRDQPQHGKLSEIRPHPSGESNKALVTYTHSGDLDQVVDRFTFQAKIVGEGNTSAPGIISLMGKRASPRLEVLEPPKFKRLQPGESDAGRIVIMNTGTAAFSGEIKWPPPFQGPPKLDLAVNEKQTLMLMITVPAPGAYQLNQELQPGVATSKVQAYVECVQPFVVTPGSLVLTFDAAKGSRSGKVKVSNGSDAPLKLRTDAPNRLHVAKEITIEPKSAQDLLLELDGKDVALFHGEVWIIQDPHREKIIVHAEPEPPQIRLQNPAQSTIDFGKVEKGKPGEVRLMVANDGGQTAILKPSTTPPFQLMGEGEKGLIVEPGKSQTLLLKFAPEQPGSFNGTMSIGGNGGRIDLTARGFMPDPKRPGVVPGIENPHTPPTKSVATTAPMKPRESATRPKTTPSAPPPVTPPSLSKPSASPVVVPAPTPAPKPSAASDSSSSGNALKAMVQMDGKAAAFYGHLATYGVGLEALPQFKSVILEPVPAIGVREAGRDYMVLTWATPKVEPKTYLIQTSRLVRNEATGMPLKTWTNVEGWKPVTVPAGVAAARIEGLQPNTEYEWRVLGVDHEGKLSPSSDLLRVITLPPYSVPGWVWQLLIAAVVLCGIYLLRRVREQRAFA